MVGKGSSTSSNNSQEKSCCLRDSTRGRSYSLARCSCNHCHAGVQEMENNDVLTFHNLAYFWHWLTSVLCTAVIFDTHQDISLKNATQTRQKGKKKKVSVKYPASDKADIKRLSMKEITCAERTKRNLTTYFMHQLQKHFHLRNQCFISTRNGKTVWLWQERALINIHEETDMCLPYCLLKINGSWKSAKVNPNDTNVIALLVNHPPNLYLCTTLHVK